MTNSKIVQRGLIHALGVFVYVFLVALLMNNGDRIFGQVSNALAGAGILLLLVLSVAVVGMLIFGKPAMMYFDGQKKEAVMLLLFTLGWLAVIMVVVLVLLATVFKQTGWY